MRLLIADDNFKMREMLKSIFKFHFSEIKECDDGEFAFEIYKEYKPDWVFIDIEMKKIDGITASEKILDEFPEAKIIIITNYDSLELRKKAKSAGVFDYVLKENILDILEIIR